MISISNMGTIYTCDGCGLEVRFPKERPVSWKLDLAIVNVFDLCPECTERLNKMALSLKVKEGPDVEGDARTDEGGTGSPTCGDQNPAAGSKPQHPVGSD